MKVKMMETSSSTITHGEQGVDGVIDKNGMNYKNWLYSQSAPQVG